MTSIPKADESKGALPMHVAIIMDGNGRWAQQQGMSRLRGHEEGANSVRAVTEACGNAGIPCLTLYALSKDNLAKRPKREIQGLFRLLERSVARELDSLMKNDIRLRTIGDIAGLPAKVQKSLRHVEERTAGNRHMVVCMALNYSSRDELTRTARKLAVKVRSGELRPEDITPELLGDHLDTAGMPEVDLLIRTAGEMRLSDFLLWQISYAELYVTSTLWPNFRKEQLEAALADYARRERRFGGLPG